MLCWRFEAIEDASKSRIRLNVCIDDGPVARPFMAWLL
jgi:hypothetical protein